MQSITAQFAMLRKLLVCVLLVLSPLNLCAQEVESTRLKAELLGPNAIYVQVSGIQRPLSTTAYRLTSGDGTEISIARILPRRSDDALVVPSTPVDPTRVYYIEILDSNLRARCKRDPWFRNLYSDKEMGANISIDRSETTFRLFAPRADAVRLYLYLHPDDTPEEAARTISMTRDKNGVWEAVEQGDHHGVYYDFTIHGPPDPGNFFYGTHPVHITDPYARVSDDSFGKSRIWRAMKPPRPVRGGRPAMEDVIAYEVHLQDFTALLPVDSEITGTFDAMGLSGLSNSVGQPVGFDYLVDLGINVVHLMPVQEYLHFPDREWRAAFSEDPYMIEQGIANENYQWGYRTTHAFAIESRYRRRGTDMGEERTQFRALVEAFHDRGLSVIIDVVPNHTGENMDGRHYLFNFNAIDLPYYYRTDENLEHIGPFGNEIKSEERPMVQRWMLDQLQHFVDEFGIDGFRIDLAGQIDKQTLTWIRDELDDDLIIYGEAWIAPADPDVRAEPSWSWYKADAPITFFQDDARNAFKGPVSNPKNKSFDRGYAGGDGALRERVMQGLLNSFPEERIPNRGINYLDIHDNWTLADRFAMTDWNGNLGVEMAPFRIAATLLFTSLGPIVLHGGTEMMRSKGSAPLDEQVKKTISGNVYLHGKRDSYNLRKANQFVWENVGRESSVDQPNDYAGMLSFWKGLIAFRNSEAGSVFRVGTEPPVDYFRWILPEDEQFLGYFVDERVLVLINTGVDEFQLEDLEWPKGIWKLISDGREIDLENGLDTDSFDSTEPPAFRVPGQTAQIWQKVTG